jgi:hypothetical protein
MDNRVMVYEDAGGSGQDPVKGFCEHGEEWSGSVKTGNFLIR